MRALDARFSPRLHEMAGDDRTSSSCPDRGPQGHEGAPPRPYWKRPYPCAASEVPRVAVWT